MTPTSHTAATVREDRDLCEAIGLLADRKRAAYGRMLEDGSFDDPETPFSVAPLLVGTGLTAKHVALHASMTADRALVQIHRMTESDVESDVAELTMLCGAWTEGMLTGLLIGELRARRAAQPEPEPEPAKRRTAGYLLFTGDGQPIAVSAEQLQETILRTLIGPRTPWWTWLTEGAREARRDRRRHRGASARITVHSPSRCT